MKIRKILYATDFSPFAKYAIPHLLLFRKAFDSELHILEVKDPDHDFQERCHHLISEMRELDPDLPEPVCHIRHGIAPAPEICHYACEHDIQLIVVASHGYRGVRRFFLGSTAEEITRIAHCSVLVIKGDVTWEKPRLKRILFPHDLSQHTQRHAPVVHHLEQFFDAKVHMVHVVDDQILAIGMMVGRASHLDSFPDLRKKAGVTVHQLAEDACFKEPVIEVYKGRVPTLIRDVFNDSKIDLTIVPAHGVSGEQLGDLGSTTQKIIHHVEGPILVLRNIEHNGDTYCKSRYDLK